MRVRYIKKRTRLIFSLLVIIIASILSYYIINSYAIIPVKPLYQETTNNLTILFENNENNNFIKNSNKKTVELTVKNNSDNNINYYLEINFSEELTTEQLKNLEVVINEEKYQYRDYGFVLTHPKKASLSYDITINYLDESLFTESLNYQIIFNEEEKDIDFIHYLENYSSNTYIDNFENTRYYGLNPSNYLSFNDELWRIIGIIEVDGEKTVKIIKDTPLSSLPFDNDLTYNYSSNFFESTLYNILNNEGYINSESASCVIDYRFTTCDFTETGLMPSSLEYIKKVSFFQTGHSSLNTNANKIYSLESKTTSKKLSVGILSITDYAMAANQTTTNLTDYELLKTNNWLYSGNSEQLINNNTGDSQKHFMIYENGQISIEAKVTDSYQLRPTVHLVSSLYLLSGDGTKENPYQIELTNSQ